MSLHLCLVSQLIDGDTTSTLPRQSNSEEFWGHVSLGQPELASLFFNLNGKPSPETGTLFKLNWNINSLVFQNWIGGITPANLLLPSWKLKLGKREVSLQLLTPTGDAHSGNDGLGSWVDLDLPLLCPNFLILDDIFVGGIWQKSVESWKGRRFFFHS